MQLVTWNQRQDLVTRGSPGYPQTISSPRYFLFQFFFIAFFQLSKFSVPNTFFPGGTSARASVKGEPSPPALKLVRKSFRFQYGGCAGNRNNFGSIGA